jgi:hypothetical protein
MKRVTMNLSDRSFQNVNELIRLMKNENRTVVVSNSLEIAKSILTETNAGKKVLLRDSNGNDQELKFIL